MSTRIDKLEPPKIPVPPPPTVGKGNKLEKKKGFFGRLFSANEQKSINAPPPPAKQQSPKKPVKTSAKKNSVKKTSAKTKPTKKKLTHISGVGKKTAKELKKAGFETVSDVAAAKETHLQKVDGVGKKKAKTLIKKAKKKSAKKTKTAPPKKSQKKPQKKKSAKSKPTKVSSAKPLSNSHHHVSHMIATERESIDEQITLLRNEVHEVLDDVHAFKQQLKHISNDTHDVQEAVKELRERQERVEAHVNDVTSLGLSDIKTSVSRLKKKIDAIPDAVRTPQVSQSDFVSLQKTVSDMQKELTGITGTLADMKDAGKQAKSTELFEIQSRLKKLETKPAPKQPTVTVSDAIYEKLLAKLRSELKATPAKAKKKDESKEDGKSAKEKSPEKKDETLPKEQEPEQKTAKESKKEITLKPEEEQLVERLVLYINKYLSSHSDDEIMSFLARHGHERHHIEIALTRSKRKT